MGAVMVLFVAGSLAVGGVACYMASRGEAADRLDNLIWAMVIAGIVTAVSFAGGDKPPRQP